MLDLASLFYQPSRPPVPAPTRGWGTCPARMGFTGRLISVRTDSGGREVEVLRPLRWFRGHRRGRSGPKVVRADTD